MITNKIIFIYLLTAFLFACSGPNTSKNNRFEIFDNYITDNELVAQSQINAYRLRGWTVLDNKHLIITSTHRKIYLITLRSYCENLTTTTSIYTDQALSNRLDSKFDSVAVLTQPRHNCRIDTIHLITNEQHKELNTLKKEAL